MRDALKAYLSLASGLTEVTRQRAVAAARALQSQGEATAEQVGALAEDLLEQSRSNREAVTALVKYEVDRTLGRVGLASADEVAELSARVRVLESSVRQLTGRGRTQPPSGGEAPAEPAAVPAKETPAKKAPATSAPAERAPAKKAPAKKAAQKAPAKKAPAEAGGSGSDA